MVIKKTTSKVIQVWTPPVTSFVTVGTILRFAEELERSGIPWTVRIEDRHSDETRHLVALSARYMDTDEIPETEPPADSEEVIDE